MKSSILLNTYFKLITGYLLVFLLSVLVLGIFSVNVAARHFEDQLQRKMDLEANQLMVDYDQDGIDELRHDVNERVSLAQPSRMLYSIVHADGKFEFDPVPSETEVSELKPFRGQLGMKVVRRELKNGSVLVVASPRDGIADLRKALTTHLLGVTFVTLLVGFAGGIILINRYLRRLQDIRTTAAEFGSGQVQARVPVSGRHDLFDDIAEDINAMLSRLESLLSEVQRVGSHVSHELRTPIGHVRQKLELLDASDNLPAPQAQIVRESLQDIDRALNTFSAILRLSEINSGARRSQFVNFQAGQLVQQLFETYEVITEESGRRLKFVNEGLVQVQGEGTFEVRGDPALFRQLVANLIENAIQHTPVGTEIVISTEVTAGLFCLEVRDNGPGIPEPERAGTPFLKSETAGGTGLGLTLVKAIAALHDFRLHFINEGGLCVRLQMKLKT